MNYAIDLHSNNFLTCFEKNGKISSRWYYFQQGGLEKFKSILTKDDVVAVESTGNSYYFYDQINPLVQQVQIIR